MPYHFHIHGYHIINHRLALVHNQTIKYTTKTRKLKITYKMYLAGQKSFFTDIVACSRSYA